MLLILGALYVLERCRALQGYVVSKYTEIVKKMSRNFVK